MMNWIRRTSIMKFMLGGFVVGFPIGIVLNFICK